jgi:hypothetical protein
LVSVIDEGEECAVAIHLVHAMLDEGIEGYVAARDWFGRWSFWDMERERSGREVCGDFICAYPFVVIDNLGWRRG